MYLQGQIVGNRAVCKLIAVMVLLLVALPFAYAQDSTDSTTDAQAGIAGRWPAGEKCCQGDAASDH